MTKMTVTPTKKMLTVIIHIAVWSCFLLLPFIFQPHSKDSPSPVGLSPHFRAVLIISSIYLISFYYLNTLLLIPNLFFKKRWGWYIASIVALLVLFLYLPEWMSSLVSDQLPEPNIPMGMRDFPPLPYDSLAPNHPLASPRGHGKHHFHFFPGSYWIFLLVFAISTCISVIQQWLRLEANTKEIEKEKLGTELQFLKSQVNPHFIFNTLNNIYSLALTGSDKTASSILKLSAIMRYIISDAAINFVSLEKEVEFTKHIIDLQMDRLTDKVSVDFVVEGSVEHKMIAPLMFIPFVENAFKYGVSTKENTKITFRLETFSNEIIFSASNTKVKSENDNRETTGIGINNVKRRLALLYPYKHILQIDETEKLFSVKLQIELL